MKKLNWLAWLKKHSPLLLLILNSFIIGNLFLLSSHCQPIWKPHIGDFSIVEAYWESTGSEESWILDTDVVIVRIRNDNVSASCLTSYTLNGSFSVNIGGGGSPPINTGETVDVRFTVKNLDQTRSKAVAVNMTVSVKDSFYGYTQDTVSVYFRLLPSTELSVRASPTTQEGQPLTISAKLMKYSNTPVSGKNVDFFIQPADGVWKKIGSAETDSSGTASLVYIPNKAGSYQVKATFQGDRNYGLSNSTIFHFTATQPPNWTLWIVGVTVMGGLVIAAIGILKFKRKPSEVTKALDQTVTTSISKKKPKPTMPKKAINCIHCGEILPPEAAYCRKCGKKLG